MDGGPDHRSGHINRIAMLVGKYPGADLFSDTFQQECFGRPGRCQVAARSGGLHLDHQAAAGPDKIGIGQGQGRIRQKGEPAISGDRLPSRPHLHLQPQGIRVKGESHRLHRRQEWPRVAGSVPQYGGEAGIDGERVPQDDTKNLLGYSSPRPVVISEHRCQHPIEP